MQSINRDRTAVHAVAEALRLAVNAGDVAGILACWAPEGVLLPPNHPAVHGHAAIATYFREVFAVRHLTFTFTDSTISTDGDLAIERLAYKAVAVPVAGGPPSEDAGKGMHVYARDAGGRWLLTQDIWNSDRVVER